MLVRTPRKRSTLASRRSALSKPLTLRDAERVRLIRALERRGLSEEAIALAFARHGEVIDSLLDRLDLAAVRRPTTNSRATATA